MELLIKTSFVSPVTMERFSNDNWLPFFCLRSIYKSSIIGKYTDTSIHLKSLSPTSILYQKYRDGIIDTNEYFEEFKQELKPINLKQIIEKIKYMVDLCDATGAVLLSYGTNPDISHRSVLGELINDLGILEYPVEEFKLL